MKLQSSRQTRYSFSAWLLTKDAEACGLSDHFYFETMVESLVESQVGLATYM